MTATPDPRHADHRETGDLALAAYAHMMGIKVLKAEDFKRGRITEYKFTLLDPESRWEQICIDWANSESQQHDSSVRMLKRLCQRVTKPGQ